VGDIWSTQGVFHEVLHTCWLKCLFYSRCKDSYDVNKVGASHLWQHQHNSTPPSVVDNTVSHAHA